MEYNERIRDLREEHDLKQSTIAKVLGIDQSYYSKYELGKHPMKAQQIKTLALYYNVSADYILGLTNEYRALKK